MYEIDNHEDISVNRVDKYKALESLQRGRDKICQTAEGSSETLYYSTELPTPASTTLLHLGMVVEWWCCSLVGCV